MFKTIIFDMGNVIINVDASRTIAAFEALGIHQGADIFTVQKQSQLCDQLEVGDINRDAFLAALADYSPRNIDPDALMAAWEAMVLHTTPERLRILQVLRQHYDVFLLSNTNEIHYDTVTRHLNTHDVDTIESLFDRTYLSYQVGHRKPTAAIFEHVAQDAKLNPAETLFIDDLPANLEIPNAMGWQTWHVADIDVMWARVERLLIK